MSTTSSHYAPLPIVFTTSLGALYRLPRQALLDNTMAALPLGIARTAIDTLVEIAAGGKATGGRRSTPRRADEGPGRCRARRGPVSLRPLCRRRNLFSFSSRRRTANRSTTGISPACAAPAATTTRSPACSQSRRGWLFVELIPGSRHTAPRVSAVVEALAFNLSVSLSSQRRTKILESINDRRSRSFRPGIARSRSTSF